MDESLQNKVQSWLLKQGYPLEMEIASYSKAAGFEVSQSDYYIDPDNDKPREIDLHVKVNNFIDDHNLSFDLFIECKSSRDKPWVIFSSENDPTYSQKDKKVSRNFYIWGSYIFSDYAGNLMLEMLNDEVMDKIYPRPTINPFVGHGVTRALTESTDVPFQAMMGATKAALSHVKRQSTYGFLFHQFQIAIPVVVTDAPIFNVMNSQVGSALELSEISIAPVLWKHVVGGRSRTGVYIVRNTAYKDFISQCKTSADMWLNIDKAKLEMAVALQKSKNK